MSNLWHFGDSWGTCDYKETIFSHYIAEHFGYKFQYHCEGGLSNYSILSRILSNVDKISENDILLCNWSYKIRLDGLNMDKDKGDILLNSLCGLDSSELSHISDATLHEHMKWILDGAINHSELEYYKFAMITKSLFDALTRKGITIFNVFLNPPLSWQPKFPTYTIEFHKVDSYDRWLWNKGWANDESIHYTWGIQEELSKYYIDHMSKLHSSLSTTTDHSYQ